MPPITYVSRYGLKVHLKASYQQLHRHVDDLTAQYGPDVPAGWPSLGRRLAALQQHLLAELRWLRSIAPSADSTAVVFGDAGRRAFLKRYSSELIYLARALKAAVAAGPVRDDYPLEQYEKTWRRVSTGVVRVLALEDEARQL